MRSVNTLIRYAQEGIDNKDWYQKANESFIALCEKEKWDFDKFVDIVALTSPRTSVKSNLYFAKYFMIFDRLPEKGVIQSVRRSVENYLEDGIIKGLKTSQFAEALKLNPDAVVLDVWMSRALEVPQEEFSKKGSTIRIESRNRVEKASERLGWTCIETQAAIWATACRNGGRVNIGVF